MPEEFQSIVLLCPKPDFIDQQIPPTCILGGLSWFTWCPMEFFDYFGLDSNCTAVIFRATGLCYLLMTSF